MVSWGSLSPHPTDLPDHCPAGVSDSLYLRRLIPGELYSPSHPTQPTYSQSDLLAAGTRDLVAAGEGDLMAGVYATAVGLHAGGGTSLAN